MRDAYAARLDPCSYMIAHWDGLHRFGHDVPEHAHKTTQQQHEALKTRHATESTLLGFGAWEWSLMVTLTMFPSASN